MRTRDEALSLIEERIKRLEFGYDKEGAALIDKMISDLMWGDVSRETKRAIKRFALRLANEVVK